MGLKDPSPQTLVGKKIDPTNIKEFIAEAQVLRNKAFEYSHFIGINNGKIAKVFTHTYRNVNSAPISPMKGPAGSQWLRNKACSSGCRVSSIVLPVKLQEV